MKCHLPVNHIILLLTLSATLIPHHTPTSASPLPPLTAPFSTRATPATPCTKQSDCRSATTYCSAAKTCIPIPYAPVIPAKGLPATTGTTPLTLLMLSDVQYDFIKCKDEPLSQCIYTNLASSKTEALALAARKQAACVKQLSARLSPVGAVFDNGDITNFGAEDQVRRIEEFHTMQLGKESNLPIAIQLGNHDYRLADDDGSIRTIAYFESSLRTLASKLAVRSVDFNSTDVLEGPSGERVKFSRGSLAYSLDFNHYVFILLHWATAQGNAGLWTPTPTAIDTRNGNSTHRIDITPPNDWLYDEMRRATAEGKGIILMPHSYRGLAKFAKKQRGFREVVAGSNVLAVISGHDHDAYGFDSTWRVRARIPGVRRRVRKRIPVYYTGSVTYQKLIAVSLKENKGGIGVTVYDTDGGEKCSRTGPSSARD